MLYRQHITENWLFLHNDIVMVWIRVLELNLALEMYWNKQVPQREMLHYTQKGRGFGHCWSHLLTINTHPNSPGNNLNIRDRTSPESVLSSNTRSLVWGEHTPSPVPNHVLPNQCAAVKQEASSMCLPAPMFNKPAEHPVLGLSKLTGMHIHCQGGLASRLPTTFTHISFSCIAQNHRMTEC